MATPVINSGQFSLGPNNSITIFDATGEINLGTFTELTFESRPIQDRRKINLMNGSTYDLVFNHGWEGRISIQRTNPFLDQYWGILEVNVRAGLPYPTFTIVQTIRETDGTTSRFTFQGAILTYDQAGTWQNEEGVVQMLSFTAPYRIIG